MQSKDEISLDEKKILRVTCPSLGSSNTVFFSFAQHWKYGVQRIIPLYNISGHITWPKKIHFIFNKLVFEIVIFSFHFSSYIKRGFALQRKKDFEFWSYKNKNVLWTIQNVEWKTCFLLITVKINEKLETVGEIDGQSGRKKLRPDRVAISVNRNALISKKYEKFVPTSFFLVFFWVVRWKSQEII